MVAAEMWDVLPYRLCLELHVHNNVHGMRRMLVPLWSPRTTTPGPTLGVCIAAEPRHRW